MRALSRSGGRSRHSFRVDADPPSGSIDFHLVYDDRARDFDARAANKSAISIGILRMFKELGIDFAYPTQTTFTAAPDGTMVMPYATVQPVVRVTGDEAASATRKARRRGA